MGVWHVWQFPLWRCRRDLGGWPIHAPLQIEIRRNNERARKVVRFSLFFSGAFSFMLRIRRGYMATKRGRVSALKYTIAILYADYLIIS